jgi:transcriptional regulator with XRE-family HTH domain
MVDMKHSFGEQLKDLRNGRGLSQEGLALKLNAEFGSSINKGMISKWENDLEEPRLDAARNIALYFNVALDDLLSITNKVLSKKEERDIAKDLEKMISDLNTNEAMAFHGEAMDEESKELLLISLENSMRLAKKLAKQKFNPNKHKE